MEKWELLQFPKGMKTILYEVGYFKAKFSSKSTLLGWFLAHILIKGLVNPYYEPQ